MAKDNALYTISVVVEEDTKSPFDDMHLIEIHWGDVIAVGNGPIDTSIPKVKSDSLQPLTTRLSGMSWYTDCIIYS